MSDLYSNPRCSGKNTYAQLKTIQLLLRRKGSAIGMGCIHRASAKFFAKGISKKIEAMDLGGTKLYYSIEGEGMDCVLTLSLNSQKEADNEQISR